MLFMKTKRLFPVLLLLLLFFMPKAALSADELILSVHPFLPASELVKRFTPLAEYLSSKTGQTVVLKISKDYNEQIENAGKDVSDIAYLGPASYVIMTERYGTKPLLARQSVGGSPTFRGAIIVRKDSLIKNITDLKGKKFAFGDRSSTMSYIIPRFMLIEAGVRRPDDIADYRHLDNHNNVALGVLTGDYDAGAVKEEVFHNYEERGLRVLAWTPAISDHLFVGSSRLHEKTVKKIREALYALKETEEGRSIMAIIKADMTAMIPVEDSDYDNLRRILKTLQENGISYDQ